MELHNIRENESIRIMCKLSNGHLKHSKRHLIDIFRSGQSVKMEDQKKAAAAAVLALLLLEDEES